MGLLSEYVCLEFGSLSWMLLLLSELFCGCGWCLLHFWRSIFFFSPSSHLVFVFKPDEHKIERNWNSAEYKNGRWVVKAIQTQTHSGRRLQMERASTCCQYRSQAWGSNTSGLIGCPLICSVLTDLEVDVCVHTMHLYIGWQTKITGGIVPQMLFFGGW